MKLKPLLFAVSLLATSCTLRLAPFVAQEPGPERGVVGQQLNFAASAFCRVVDSLQVSLRFSWGDGDTSDWVVAAQRETVTMSHAWTDSGHFVVKVQAADAHGTRSDWLGGGRVAIYDTAMVPWVVSLSSISEACPAVGADGVIYVPTHSGLVALNANGTTKWTMEEFDGDQSPVVGTDGTIYVLHGGLLTAVNPDATVRWSDSMPYHAHAPALGNDGTIYASSYDTAVAVRSDGSIFWRARLPGWAACSPAIGTDGTICYVAMGPTDLCALAPDGSRKWTAGIDCSGWLAAGANGMFFADGWHLAGVNSDGSVAWTRSTDYSVNAAVLDLAGNLLVPQYDRLLAVNPFSGEDEWSWGCIHPRRSALVRENGDVIVPCAGGDYEGTPVIACLDSTLSERWRLDIDSDPVMAPGIGPDGTVYVGTTGGYLYAVKGAPLADTPWPKFGHDSRNTGCAAGQ